MKLHLQKEIGSLRQPRRKPFREHHGSCTDSPSAEMPRAATCHAASPPPAKPRPPARTPPPPHPPPPLRAGACREASACDLGEERMMNDLSRARPKLDPSHPLVFGQLRGNDEIAKHVRPARGERESRRP